MHKPDSDITRRVPVPRLRTPKPDGKLPQTVPATPVRVDLTHVVRRRAEDDTRRIRR
jgi:hypothetical protein